MRRRRSSSCHADAVPARRVLRHLDRGRTTDRASPRARPRPHRPQPTQPSLTVRHRIGAQRVAAWLHRQRRAARQPDAGMVAGADLLVDAVLVRTDALAAPSAAPRSVGRMRRWRASWHSPSATITFRPGVRGRHRLASARPSWCRRRRCARCFSHLTPIAAQRVLDRAIVRDARLVVAPVCRRRWRRQELLRAGRRRVAVLHDRPARRRRD